MTTFISANVSASPDLKNLDIPIDTWTRPFWEATASQRLVLPRCGECQRFRWPPGPFCPACRSQHVEWQPAGAGYIYSFTVVHGKAASDVAQPAQSLVPALIEFPEAGGVRLLASIVDTALSAIRIGARVEPDWSQAANATVPVFKIRNE